MTKRLYHDSAYHTTFESQIVDRKEAEDRLGIVLEETLFYPDCGGQPHDLGALNGIPLLAVEEDEKDTIVHWFPSEAQLPDDKIHGEIDWVRRFDHMQQHTGQHILSQAFVQTLDKDTVGFHLSAAYSTIDLNTDSLTPEQLAHAETLANQIVYENRQVLTSFVDDVQVKELPLRKAPSVSGTIRIVNIEGFNWSACGGTHVARTGAVGIIKVVRLEHRGSETRITFLCGKRALAHYDSLTKLTDNLARQFSVGVDELLDSIERLQNLARTDRKKKEDLQQQLLDLEAQALRTRRRKTGAISLVTQVFEGRTQDEVREIAKRLVSEPATIALLGILPATDKSQVERKARVVFARSDDIDQNMRELLNTVCQLVSGGGGGSPDLAQGGGIPETRLDEAIAQAVEWLHL